LLPFSSRKTISTGWCSNSSEGLYMRNIPYRMDTLGTAESVKSLTRENLKEYYSKMVVPQNMVLTVVGDVETKQVALAAQKAFGNLKRGDVSSPPVPPESPLPHMRRSENYQKKEQAHFVLGFLGPPFETKIIMPWRSWMLPYPAREEGFSIN